MNIDFDPEPNLGLKIQGYTNTKLASIFKNARITFVDHHLSHAAGSFLTSGFEEANVFSFDGAGDFHPAAAHGEDHRLNNSTLKREKYNLIREIKEYYNLGNFLSSKVKNYAVYASVYKLFEYKNISPAEKTESHFNLVEHVTTTKKNNINSSLSAVLPKDEDLRIITYKTLLEKFNSKYTKLNYPQKSLLRAYINNVSNTNSLKEYIETVTPVIKRELKKYSKNLSDDVVKIKLKEAIKSVDGFLGTTKSNFVKDKVVVQTMRYMELLKELKKSGSKKQKVI